MKGHQFRKLLIWQKGMTLVNNIYKLTEAFPLKEQYGSTDQLRRAAISIPLNIAEGSGSSSNREFSHFLSIARRSGYEVITALEVARNLHYSETVPKLISEAEELCSMIVGFSKQLK